MPHYFRHCAMNPNTLVTKFLGMYRLKLYHLRRNVKFVVMKSVYDTDKHLHQLYDVKGSSTGRDANPGDAVKKDNDVRRALPDGAFVLEPGLREKLKLQVERDCDWLRAMKIMDYSMLIGVHNISHRSHKRSVSTPGKPRSKVYDDTTTKSNREDGDEFSSTSFDASYATLDHFLDEDDDDSYLDGAHHHQPRGGKTRVVQEVVSSDAALSSVSVTMNTDNKKKSSIESETVVEKAIEDMYWPFHRYYDIQGRRRLNPIRESLIAEPKKDKSKKAEQLIEEESNMNWKTLFASRHPSSLSTGGSSGLPTFEIPLSERKDGGFVMDLTDVNTPLKLNVPGAPHMTEYCDGKIFYMGIIDILQQFNIRKRFEARFRRMGGKGWEAASCVHPNLYADRFVRFFDEYTAKSPVTDNSNENELEADSASVASRVKKSE